MIFRTLKEVCTVIFYSNLLTFCRFFSSTSHPDHNRPGWVGFRKKEGAEGGEGGYPREREHFYPELSGLQTWQVT